MAKIRKTPLLTKEAFAFNQELRKRITPQARNEIVASNEAIKDEYLEQVINGVVPRIRTFLVLREVLYGQNELEARSNFFQLYKKAKYKYCKLSDNDQTMLLKLVLMRATNTNISVIANLSVGKLSLKKLLAFEAGKELLSYSDFKQYLTRCKPLKTQSDQYLTWYAGLTEPETQQPDVFSPLYVESKPIIESKMNPFHIDQFDAPIVNRSALAVKCDMVAYKSLMRKIRDILGYFTWDGGYAISSMKVFLCGNVVTPLPAALQIVSRLKEHVDLQREYLTFLSQGLPKKDMELLIEAANTDGYEQKSIAVSDIKQSVPKSKKVKETINRYEVWNGSPPTNAIQVGKMLRDFRILSGKTQRMVAKEIGVTNNCVCLWESGRLPSKRFRIRLIKSLIPGVTKKGLAETLADLAILD